MYLQNISAPTKLETIATLHPLDHKMISLTLDKKTRTKSNRFFFLPDYLNDKNVYANIQQILQKNESWNELKKTLGYYLKNIVLEEKSKLFAEETKLKTELEKSFGKPEHAFVTEKIKLLNELKVRNRIIKNDTQTSLPTPFLSQLLKDQTKKNEIKLGSTPQQNASRLATYWNDIHKKKHLDAVSMNTFLQTVKRVELPPDLEEKITLQEVLNSIEALNEKASPGTDQIPACIYKVFKELIAPKLLQQFVKALNCKKLTSGMNTAAIRFLLKKDADPLLPKSYRPISLTNIDSKVLSSIFAARLQKIIGKIAPQQKAYIKNRIIHDNIFTLDELLKDPDSIAFLSDFTAAFDSVDHGWLLLVLQSMGFGDYFLNAIETLLSDLVAYPIVDSRIFYENSIRLQGGVRQGDPLSGLLFLIALQPLIDFITTKFKNANILCFADDLATVFFNPSQARHIVDAFKKFGTASGLLLNPSKSILITIKKLQLTK